jgi:hypothetical protein
MPLNDKTQRQADSPGKRRQDFIEFWYALSIMFAFVFGAPGLLLIGIQKGLAAGTIFLVLGAACTVGAILTHRTLQRLKTRPTNGGLC